MVNVPPAIVDFAAALKMLADSQGDISEIVTKWDLICDTTTPRTVTVELSDGVHEVDNLAKIREDLVKGLSLSDPSVNSLKLTTKYGPDTAFLTAGRQTYMTRFDGSDSDSSFHDAYEKYAGNRGIIRNMRNTFYSCCYAQKPDIHVGLFDLARFIWLGYPASSSDAPISTYNLYISAPVVNETLYASGRQYCTEVTFVGARADFNGNSQGSVTLRIIHSDDGQLVDEFTIPYGGTVTLLIWAYPGQNAVAVLKIGDSQLRHTLKDAGL